MLRTNCAFLSSPSLSQPILSLQFTLRLPLQRRYSPPIRSLYLFLVHYFPINYSKFPPFIQLPLSTPLLLPSQAPVLKTPSCSARSKTGSPTLNPVGGPTVITSHHGRPFTNLAKHHQSPPNGKQQASLGTCLGLPPQTTIIRCSGLHYTCSALPLA